MSLKHFHLVFISAALLSCFGFAFYALAGVSGAVKEQLAAAGWSALALGLALCVYAPFWVKKARSIPDSD